MLVFTFSIGRANNRFLLALIFVLLQGKLTMFKLNDLQKVALRDLLGDWRDDDSYRGEPTGQEFVSFFISGRDGLRDIEAIVGGADEAVVAAKRFLTDLACVQYRLRLAA